MHNFTLGMVPEPPFLNNCFLTSTCNGNTGTNFETVRDILTPSGAGVTPAPFKQYRHLNPRFADGRVDIIGCDLRTAVWFTGKTLVERGKLSDASKFSHYIIPAGDTRILLGYPSNRYFRKSKSLGPLSGSLFKIISYEVLFIAVLISAIFKLLNYFLSLPRVKRCIFICGPLILMLSQYYSLLSLSLIGKLITIQIALPAVDHPIDTVDELINCFNRKRCCLVYSKHMSSRGDEADFKKYFLYLTRRGSVFYNVSDTKLANAITAAKVIHVDARNVFELAYKAYAYPGSCYPVLWYAVPNRETMESLQMKGLIKWVDFTTANPSLLRRPFGYIINAHLNKSQYRLAVKAFLSGSVTNLYSDNLNSDILRMKRQWTRRMVRQKASLKAKLTQKSTKKSAHDARVENSENSSIHKPIYISSLWNAMGPVLMLLSVAASALLVEGRENSADPNRLLTQMSMEESNTYKALLNQLDIFVDEKSLIVLHKLVQNENSALHTIQTIAKLRERASTNSN